MTLLVPAVTLALPVIHAFASLTSQQLHPVPLTISGVVCTTPHDMKEMYRLSLKGGVKSLNDLVAKAGEAGYSCTVLQNSPVLNGGPVMGPDGEIDVASGAQLPIYELIRSENGSDRYYYVIGKKN